METLLHHKKAWHDVLCQQVLLFGQVFYVTAHVDHHLHVLQEDNLPSDTFFLSGSFLRLGT
jgi:hypothetical protein